MAEQRNNVLSTDRSRHLRTWDWVIRIRGSPLRSANECNNCGPLTNGSDFPFRRIVLNGCVRMCGRRTEPENRWLEIGPASGIIGFSFLSNATARFSQDYFVYTRLTGAV